jgi:hypothetical protein
VEQLLQCRVSLKRLTDNSSQAHTHMHTNMHTHAHAHTHKT